MAVVKIKRSKTEESSEEPSQAKKKIKIKTKLKEDNSKVIPKIKINLKKEDHSDSANIVKKAGPIKVKLNLKKKDENNNGIKVKRHEPRVRVKAIRIPGEGYDSEDSDVESDPLIESGIILRVVPDTQVDFVKNSIEAGDYSGIGIKWITERHAAVMINGYMYGAILVDLPTIIEVNKSVDRKNLLKTFDVSQMLLCIKTIDKEEEVFDLQVPDTEDMVSNHYEDIIEEIHREKIKLLRQHLSHGNHDITPQQIDKIAIKSYDYKHGLTAPLYNVRNRRFRRKMNPTEFEYVENVVETLLNEDDKAEEVTFELITEDEINTKPLPLTSQSHLNLSSQQQVSSATIKTNPLASSVVTENSGIKLENREIKEKGENMEEKEKDDGEDDDDDELDLEAAFESEEEEEEAKDLQGEVKNHNDITSSTKNKVNGEEEDVFEGSGAEEGAVEEDESEEDEDEEEEDDDDEDDEDDDDDDNESRGGRDKKRQHIELLEDELKELETTLTQTIRKVEKATNPLLKSRFVESIKKLEKEVELKKKQLKANEESIQHSSKVDEDATTINDGNEKHIDSKRQEQPNNDGEEDEDEDVDDDDDVEADEDDDEDEDEEESVEDNNREVRQEQTNKTENNENPENEDESLDQNDLDMMMLFGAEAEEDDE